MCVGAKNIVDKCVGLNLNGLVQMEPMTTCSPENHKTDMERIVNVVGEQKQANACVHLLNIVVFKANNSSCAGNLAAQATCPSNSSLITAASPTMAGPTTRATKRKAGPSTSAPKKKKSRKRKRHPQPSTEQIGDSAKPKMRLLRMLLMA